MSLPSFSRCPSPLPRLLQPKKIKPGPTPLLFLPLSITPQSSNFPPATHLVRRGPAEPPAGTQTPWPMGTELRIRIPVSSSVHPQPSRPSPTILLSPVLLPILPLFLFPLLTWLAGAL
ncbi:hypothetical protein DPEC_G00002990 [Dallia pectoralis]|uniref:Uncharacterized protein n=1 Tax=Dallia pectoralis TaxID=75939 RepID=A0ACC2HJ70_DALPE|nr:hypothetical protein DPEC_G00002990 [Dallia pectoralis]